MSWPYDEMDDPTAEQRDDEAEREEHEQAARERLGEHAPTTWPRVVVEESPPGEGDPQIEFYRALTGAKSVKSMRVEWEPMSDEAIRGGNDPF